MWLVGFVLKEREIHQLAEHYRYASPQKIVAAAVERIPNLTLACSFGAEDMVLLDILMKIKPEAAVFYLDTDVLFKETYALRDVAITKYGISNLSRIQSRLSLAQQAKQYGPALWEREPNVCCNIRKVLPLENVLTGYDGWISGIRREQAPTRASAEVFEMDKRFGLVKVNPLALWSHADVWAHIHAHDVLYNPLHDQGYPSIGCSHCTRPVNSGEDPRAGRWAGFEKTECGLHEEARGTKRL